MAQQCLQQKGSKMLTIAFNSVLWTPTKAEWVAAGNLIQVEERKRISEFYFKNDAKLSLAARLLLRYAVTHRTPVKWKDLRLKRTEKSKPYIDFPEQCDIWFNASHQGDYAVVVADCNANVGIDIMDTRETHGNVNEFFRLMERQFTKDEWTTIHSYTNEKDQMNSFYRHWCLKESYVKALGDGISYSLQSLSFKTQSEVSESMPAIDTLLYINGSLNADWSFEERMLDQHHCVAVAMNSKHPKILPSFEVLTFDDIVSVAQSLESDRNVDELFVHSFDKPHKARR